MSYLVIDVGTSGLRAAVVGDDARIRHEVHREMLPSTPEPGLVEFDAAAMAVTALELAAVVLEAHGPVRGVGIANQRGSTVVWDRNTGEPVAPGLGWQDLRTLGDCLGLQAVGHRFAPNQAATKIKHLLDLHDPDRSRDLCAGSVDSWIAWHLTGGAAHLIDATNAAISGLFAHDGSGWDNAALDALDIPAHVLPTIVDSSGELAVATALDGAPPLLGMAGDQQSSLIGQGCVRPGPAKITFGTGGMLDLVLEGDGPSAFHRHGGGTFPIVAWRRDGATTWGLEGIMLSAGTNVEWLRDDLGVIATAAESHDVAAQCEHTDGVVYVPALLGLGTPRWDYGARGALLGVTRGTGRPQVVRAVLEGVAQRGADLVDAAERDGGIRIEVIRIDGGMSRNPTFVQALADATQRPVEVSPVVEATTVGAALLAGLAGGTWSGMGDVAATWRPATVVEPARSLDRDRWADAVERAAGWYPELSGLDF